MNELKLKINSAENSSSSSQVTSITNLPLTTGQSAPLSNTSIKTLENGTFVKLPQGESVYPLSFLNGLKIKNNYVDNALFTTSGYGKLTSENNPKALIFNATEVFIGVKGENITGLVIVGDEESGQFPTSAQITHKNGTVYSVSNRSFQWNLATVNGEPLSNFYDENNGIQILFTAWKRSNYPAIITAIRSLNGENPEIEIDIYNGLQEVESLTQATGQPKEIWFGAIANSGSAKILDYKDEILKHINNGDLPYNNVPVALLLNGNVIQKHIINDSDYSQNKEFTLQMTNSIEQLNSVMYQGYFNENGATLYTIVVNAFNQIGGFSETMLTSRIKARLQSINYLPAFVPSMPFKDFVDKVCQVALLSFVEQQDGSMAFIDMLSAETNPQIIRIPNKGQTTNIAKDIIIKNQIDRVKWQENVFGTENDTPIYSTNFSEDQIDNIGQITPLPQTYIGDRQGSSDTLDIAENYINYNTEDTTAPNQQLEIIRFEGKKKVYKFSIPNTTDIKELSEYSISKSCQIVMTKYESEKLGHEDTTTPFQFVIDNKQFVPIKGLKNSERIPYFREKIPEVFSNRGSESILTVESSGILINNNYSAVSTFNSVISELSVNNVFPSPGGTITQDYRNGLSIQYNASANTYDVTLRLTIYAGVYRLYFITNRMRSQSPSYFYQIYMAREKQEIYLMDSVAISINGDKYVLNLKNEILSKENANVSNPHLYTLPQNELIQQNATIYRITGSKTLGERVAEQLLDRYENGLSTAKISVAYLDYYDTNGNLAISTKNGDMFKLGDIVVVDKDNNGTPRWQYANGNPIYWKITSVNVRKKGVIYVDLELQEIK